VAQRRILENIQTSIATRTSLINNIRTFEERTGKPLSFKNFIDYYSLTPKEVYRKDTFYALACQAGVYQDNGGSRSPFTRTAALHLSTINSPRLIRFIGSLLEHPHRRSYEDLSEAERHMLTIFYYSIFDSPLSTEEIDIASVFSAIIDNPFISNEILDLLDYNFKHLEFLPDSVDLGFDSPLEVHCTYTRDQIFSALGHYTLHHKPAQGSREGVLYLDDKKIDAFFITLNKTEEHYSPTTMYMDYAISESLFHWQSQSTTSASSSVGERYIHHEERGSKVLLFVREFKKVENRAEPYRFLGTARYVSHEGSRPMSILWELDRPLPPALFVRANKTVIG